jgi:FtsZ-binding cell division protein ZapB
MTPEQGKQWRKEWENLDRSDGGLFSVDVYLAARKKAQEELSLKDYAMSIMSEKVFLLKEELKLVNNENNPLKQETMSLRDEIESLKKENEELKEEIDALKEEYAKISCAYCGELCAREINELVLHVEKCEKHPVFKLINEKSELKSENIILREALEEEIRLAISTWTVKRAKEALALVDKKEN